MSPVKKAASAKKAVPTKKVSAVKKPPAKQAAAPAKKGPATKAGGSVAAKKAVTKTATKAAAKKAVPVKKTPAKAAAKTAAPAKKAPAKVAAKAAGKTAAPAKTAAKKAAPAAKKAAAPAAAKATKVKPEPPAKKLPAGKTCPLSGIFVPKQSSNITPKTLEKLKELLLEERTRHVRQAADLLAEADALVTEREQGDTQFDEESGEGDTISVERERDLMLSATANQQVEEIDAALARMDAGTYGLCTPAGRRISVARLEAIPWAETCVECKQRVERRR